MGRYPLRRRTPLSLGNLSIASQSGAMAVPSDPETTDRGNDICGSNSGAEDAEARRIAAELVCLYQAGAIKSVGDAVAHARAIAYPETCSRAPETGGAAISGDELPGEIRKMLARAEVEHPAEDNMLRPER